MLKGEPAVLEAGFSLVDVCDIAALQLAAMITPEAAGKLFIEVSRFV